MPNYDNYTKEQAIEELKKLKRQKKFGLVWEDKPEQVVEDCKHNFPVLTECKDKKIVASTSLSDLSPRWVSVAEPADPTHLIIEGDNYHALSVLNVTHKGKIDVIYIDPPYNTGNKDFKYNDDYVDKEDSFRHSKWLSFMEKRLKLAKDLLSDTGVIFISIDDNEQANLKLLCDSVFGESNFLNTIIWKKNSTTVMLNKEGFSSNTEFILLYKKKNVVTLNNNEISERLANSYNKDDNDGRGKYGTVHLYTNTNTNKLVSLRMPDGSDFEAKWHVTQAKFDEYFNKGLIIKTPSGWRKKIYLSNCKGSVPVTLLDTESVGTTKTGTGEISQIFGTSIFAYPKPTTLIKYFINKYPQKEIIILDFFAGSGTTGHAVLELNKEDGGNRQFILCTNNENNICEEVTYPRIKKVIEGYGAAGSPTAAGIPANVRYFKTDFVEKSEDTDENRVKITERCHELLQIKESCYDTLGANDDLPQINFYRNATKLMTVIFDRYDQKKDTYYIEEIAQQTRNNPNINEIVVYRFSIDGNLDMDISSLPNARLEEIPEEILKVYHQIFKKNKRKK